MRKTKVTFHNEKLRVSSELMRALAHPLRLRILAFIDRHGTINVNKIYGALKIEQSITSQHLRILRNAGVLRAERDGKFIFYSLDKERLAQIMRLVEELAG